MNQPVTADNQQANVFSTTHAETAVLQAYCSSLSPSGDRFLAHVLGLVY